MTSIWDPENSSAKELYSKAHFLYKAKKYAEVVPLCEILKRNYPGSKETNWASINFIKCDPMNSAKLKITIGYFIVIASVISGFLLITRVNSIFGYRFFILSYGNNVFDQTGIRLSDELFTGIWIVVILAFFLGTRNITGYWDVPSLISKGDQLSVNSDTKKCPMCAELVKREALKCKHCGHIL